MATNKLFQTGNLMVASTHVNLGYLFLLCNGVSKERSKSLVRMDSEMYLPLRIFQPISETFPKDRLAPKISL